MDPYEIIWTDNGATTIPQNFDHDSEIPGYIHRSALGSVKTVGPAFVALWNLVRNGTHADWLFCTVVKNCEKLWKVVKVVNYMLLVGLLLAISSLLGSSPWVLHKQPTLHMGSHGHSAWMWICHSMTRLWRPWSQSHCTWPPWYKYCQKSWQNLREEQSSQSYHLHGRRHVALDLSGLAMANININMPELSLQVSSTSKQWVPCNSMVIQSEYLAGWPFESEGPQQNFAARAPRLSLKHADLKGMEVRSCCPSQKPRPLPSAPVLATFQDDSCSNVQQQYYVDQSVVGCARIRRVSQLCPAPTESEEMVASSSGRCDGQSLLCDANEFWMFLTLVLWFSLFSAECLRWSRMVITSG